MTSKIRTVPERVKIYTDRFVITGFIHTKPGGYKERVSDILNDPATRFVVLTDATFRQTDDPAAPTKRCSPLVVRIDDVKLLIPFEGDPT